MADSTRPGIVLDAGALIAIESGRLTDVLAAAHAVGLPVRFSGGAVAQAWRGGPRSARLAALLKKVDVVTVVALDAGEGRRVGELVARTRGRAKKPDVVDAHAAFLTRETKSVVFTSDPDDIAAYGVQHARIRRV
jgi:hypothetical protein